MCCGVDVTDLKQIKFEEYFMTCMFRFICLPVSCRKNLKCKINKTVILPIILYLCETLSLVLKEEPRFKLFGSREKIWNPEGESNRSLEKAAY
jgi:hypothetical protein